MKAAKAGLLAFIFLIFYLGTRKIMTRKEFKEKFYREIDGLDLKGFSPLLLVSLASYESGDGNGSLAIPPNNNIFSLQAPRSWKGGTIKQKSTGNLFRTYPSYRAAVIDFINLLLGWPSNYGSATNAARAGDIENFAKALQAGGYGDPGKTTYAAELIARSRAFV